MIKTHKLHNKFSNVWRDYERNDLFRVCQSILRLMNKGFRDPIATVKNNWSQVCSFLYHWEGK